MPWPKFRENLAKARETAESFNAQNEIKSSRPYFEIPKRSFIAENFATSNKALKIASNPEFAGDFSSAGGDGQTTVENFLVSKVWINEGCIVCDACEGIYPEVFEVKSDTCVIRPDAPLDNGLKIQEAAEACPVEVIKYNKA
ncbi:MAG: ferredoxin [Halobacteriovoraceae bacterium]|nr:ferredoxin [Halobacteriovoraceae bacterium]